MDFLGLGRSGGEPRDHSLSRGMAAMQAVVSAVRRLAWVDAGRISVIGSSFGGAVSLLVQSYEQCFSRIGLKSPASDYAETLEIDRGESGMIKWRDSGYCEELGFGFEAYRDALLHNVYAAANSTAVPTLIVHGDADTDVPLHHSFRLLDVLPFGRLEVLPGVGHAYSSPGAFDRVVELLVGMVTTEGWD
ncbi:MAG: prolyl oligopeptidase family serine peptidase [bacterium]|nr:prolyl oligopeptidase family serine peptidase [bacterium]